VSKSVAAGRHGAHVAKTGVSLSHGDKTMQYMLLIHGPERDPAHTPAAEMQAMMGAYAAYTQAMKEAGVLVSGDALKSAASGTTVRVRDGKTQVLDGPYAESKEQLAGYYLIDTPDLDGALAWAARCPGASYGTMEVRPVLVYPRG